MSLFGANSAQPVQGISTTPNTARSNPDRKRREKQQKKKDEQAPREEDRADLSSLAREEQPRHAPPAGDEPPRPHIDIQG